MTEALTAKQVLDEACAQLGASLKARGYKRRARSFRRTGTDTSELIEIQASRNSTAQRLSFVINYGVIVCALAEEGEDLATMIWTECHWHKRVSGIDRKEIWFSLEMGESPEELAAKIGATLEASVIPELESLQTEEAFLALWSSGEGPGLAAMQRERLLRRLRDHKA